MSATSAAVRTACARGHDHDHVHEDILDHDHVHDGALDSNAAIDWEQCGEEQLLEHWSGRDPTVAATLARGDGRLALKMARFLAAAERGDRQPAPARVVERIAPSAPPVVLPAEPQRGTPAYSPHGLTRSSRAAAPGTVASKSRALTHTPPPGWRMPALDVRQPDGRAIELRDRRWLEQCHRRLESSGWGHDLARLAAIVAVAHRKGRDPPRYFLTLMQAERVTIEPGDVAEAQRWLLDSSGE